MNSYEAYCTACGSRVLVSLNAPPDGPIDLSDGCLDRVVSCETVDCPLVDVAPGELPNRLEFLPAAFQGGRPRDMAESSKLVERARATSVRLQVGREAGAARADDT